MGPSGMSNSGYTGPQAYDAGGFLLTPQQQLGRWNQAIQGTPLAMNTMPPDNPGFSPQVSPSPVQTTADGNSLGHVSSPMQSPTMAPTNTGFSGAGYSTGYMAPSRMNYQMPMYGQQTGYRQSPFGGLPTPSFIGYGGQGYGQSYGGGSPWAAGGNMIASLLNSIYQRQPQAQAMPTAMMRTPQRLGPGGTMAGSGGVVNGV